MTFAALLAHPGVDEVCELRGSFGFMAFHGGALEEMTDVIAATAAARCDASYYGVHQPAGMAWHIPSIEVTPAASDTLARFLQHVNVVVTVHGYGRREMFTHVLLGGRNRRLADHLAGHLGARLPAYRIVTDLASIPPELRGMHPANPVNLPAEQGVQVELPPRVRLHATHTRRLIDGLASAGASFVSKTAARPDA